MTDKSKNASLLGDPRAPRTDGAAPAGPNGMAEGDMTSGASQGGYNSCVPIREPITIAPSMPPAGIPARIVGDAVTGDPRTGSTSPSLRNPSLPAIEPVKDTATELPAKGRQT